MNALAEVTAASPVIAQYYQSLLRYSPKPVKGELLSLTHLMIGTCGVNEREAAFLCVDRTARVFAPQLLEADYLPTRAAKLRRLKQITCEKHADQAMVMIPPSTSPSDLSPYDSARTACWNLTIPVDETHLIGAAYCTAVAASDAKDFIGGIQLFKDLCAMPRE